MIQFKVAVSEKNLYVSSNRVVDSWLPAEALRLHVHHNIKKHQAMGSSPGGNHPCSTSPGILCPMLTSTLWFRYCSQLAVQMRANYFAGGDGYEPFHDTYSPGKTKHPCQGPEGTNGPDQPHLGPPPTAVGPEVLFKLRLEPQLEECWSLVQSQLRLVVDLVDSDTNLQADFLVLPWFCLPHHYESAKWWLDLILTSSLASRLDFGSTSSLCYRSGLMVGTWLPPMSLTCCLAAPQEPLRLPTLILEGAAGLCCSLTAQAYFIY